MNQYELLMLLEESGLEVLRSSANEIYVDFGVIQMVVENKSAQLFYNDTILMWPISNTREGFNGDSDKLFNVINHKHVLTRYVKLESAIPIIKQLKTN